MSAPRVSTINSNSNYLVSSRRSVLPLEVHDLLQHLVRVRDHAAIRLEPALGDDHARELLREIDVRHLECAAGHRRLTALEREAEHRTAGVARHAVHVVADALQTTRVVEVREHDLREYHVRAIRERAGD